MEERFRLIEEWKKEEWSFAELCRRYGVSAKTGYKWVKRYEAEGIEGLRERSRAPHGHSHEVVKEVADAVVEGFRPGVMARLGLGYEALAAVNPAIVLCSVSGFGKVLMVTSSIAASVPYEPANSLQRS